jgi:hypothetical protein
VIARLFLLLIAPLFAANCEAADLVKSWADVERELTPPNKVFRVPLSEHWTNSAILRTFVREYNTNALLELAGQPPGIATFASYFALRKIDPDLAQDVGLRFGLTTSPIRNEFVLAVVKQVVSDLPRPSFNEAWTKALRLGPVDPESARILIRSLPVNTLKEWFEANDRLPVMPRFEALVLDQLYGELLKQRGRPTKKMTETVNAYALVPGEPRVVFLVWADEGAPEFENAFKAALEDDLSLPALSGLIIQKAEYIQKHLNLKQLNVSDERKAFMLENLAQGLDMAAKRKQVKPGS